MIISKNSIIDATGFLNHLGRTIKGVWRIAVDAPAVQYCTGWLLTEKLVVIPGFMGKAGDRFTCLNLSSGSPETFTATLVYQAPEQRENHPALLLLEKPVPHPPLELAAETPGTDDPIYILQHPDARPNPHISFGKIMEPTGSWLTYNADTLPGSSGSPVISALSGKLIGMHYSSDAPRKLNRGLMIGNILESFRQSEYWESIRNYHKLADMVPLAKPVFSPESSPSWSPIHVKAAVSWNLDPATLSPGDHEALKPHVTETLSPRWSLKPSARQQILQSVPVSELKKAAAETASDHPGQPVIRRILEGGPFRLEEAPEAELPYWLQAVRWFAPVAPGLPGPSDVHRVLEKKRIRSRLTLLGGQEFRGRKTQLDQLAAWYEKEQAGPMLLTGIGGIGKSALVSRFALSLSPDTLLLWLDFDRPDLAPDDAASVLKILSEQISLQAGGFTPPGGGEAWEQAAGRLGEMLSSLTGKGAAPLLALDGFEVAQHVKQYQEIWTFLERVLSQCPRLKIVVSGRAPVPGLMLGGLAAENIHLKGMEPGEARALLAHHRITDPAITDRVVEISRGIPLVLRLAVQFVAGGGRMEDLPANLSHALIEGYLYQRILDRVIDPQLKPVAREALLLRRLTPGLIGALLAHALPEGSNAEEVFEGLAREMGITGRPESPAPGGGASLTILQEEGVLQLRPEVRSATLKLLEAEAPDWVRTIDEKAVDYYRRQNADIPENAAELVYHLLRLGRQQEAEATWRPELAPLLKYAAEDLPESAAGARDWLEEKIGQVMGGTEDHVLIWEREAQEQIINMLERGHFKGVTEILKQRTERSDNSPLLPYDAWMALSEDDLPRAAGLLEKSHPASPVARRNQQVFRALLEVQRGDANAADRYLAQAGTANWDDRHSGKLEALALQAARIRLTVNLETELDLMRRFQAQPVPLGGMKGYVQARDVVLPFLVQQLGADWNLESVGSRVELPVTEWSLHHFAAALEEEFSFGWKGRFRLSVNDLQDLFAQNGEVLESMVQEPNGLSTQVNQQLAHISLSSSFRWKMATTSFMLGDFAGVAAQEKEVLDPLELSILATLAAFRGQEMNVSIGGYSEPTIDAFLKRVIRNHSRMAASPIDARRRNLLLDLINQEAGERFGKPGSVLSKPLVTRLVEALYSMNTGFISLEPLFSVFDKNLSGLLLYLSGPDPLEMLCRRLLGLPDNYRFRGGGAHH